jgi:AcrR family transcriptional regulator
MSETMPEFALPLPPADLASMPAGVPVADRAHQSEEWVEAACKLLAYGCRVEELTSQSLAEIVGVPESRLLQHYPRKDDFLIAVLKRLLNEVSQAARVATQDEPPSLFRVCRGIWASLNAQLRRPAIPLLWRALKTHAEVQSIEQTRNAAQLAAMQAELEGAGVTQAASTARTVLAMAKDIADAEHSAGHALAERRRAICGYLRDLRPEDA